MSSQTVNKEMTLVEKVEMIEVNPRYDMTGLQLMELADAAAGGHSLFPQNQFLDAVHLGFKLGYQQGEKAVKKKMEMPIKNPKCKSEYRDAIYSNLKQVKYKEYLVQLHKYSAMLIGYDYLSENESRTSMVIQMLLNKQFTDDEIAFIGYMLMEFEKGRVQQ